MIELSLVNNPTSIDIHIHFYFKENELHSMNAIIFNECEKQFIKAIKNIDKFLNEPLDIQVFAKEEGGLIENLQIIVNQPMTVGIVAGLVSAFCTAFFTAKFNPKLPLSQEVKNKLENILTIKEAIASNNLTEEEFNYIAGNNKELLKFRSSFFNMAKSDKTLKQVEIDTDTQIGDRLIFDKISVPYEKFDDFILKDNDDNEDKTDIDEKEARIYIIAPILVKGRKDHWKGFCNGEAIDFILSDKDFLEQVYSQEIKFGNGTYLDCKLKITTIYIQKGKETITREVVVVNEYGDEENFVKPIIRKARKTEDKGQNLLIFDDGDK